MPTSDSELSDLWDELEGSDSEFKLTSARSPRKKVAEEQEYRLQKALKPPRATTYTARALYDQIHNSDIDLSPEYQRDVVWTKEKQTNLIDSIYRNFYIPPIIFAVTVEDDGSERRTCIDGKQRLTSIQLFMDGLIPRQYPCLLRFRSLIFCMRNVDRDPLTGQKYWFKNVDSKDTRRQLLPEKLRTMFSNKQIVCVEYSELTDLDERDIFKRVQQGMALTPSEKLSALSTARTVFIRSLLKIYVSDAALGKLPWDTARGADFRVFSHAVYCMEMWSSNPDEVKTHGTLQQVEKWLAGADDLAEDLKAQIRETFDIFVKMVTSPKYSEPLFKYKKVSPTEMIFIPLLIFIHGVFPSSESQLTRRELCVQISDLRSFVRENNTDVRMNARIGKSLMEFIKRIEPEATPKVPAVKGKRKREEADVEQSRAPLQSNSSARRTLLTPETPTLSSASSTAHPSDDTSSAVVGPKRKKKVSSGGSTVSHPAQPTSSLQK
ncbi:hypothetical protein GYMLUDRAFT_254990 [Collybiopsis luxurians FD-317 M1]|nr:hypothetical protein GYMLUDRAFT_254990 [Collybiopsis luxurians FD-317 M1]